MFKCGDCSGTSFLGNAVCSSLGLPSLLGFVFGYSSGYLSFNVCISGGDQALLFSGYDGCPVGVDLCIDVGLQALNVQAATASTIERWKEVERYLFKAWDVFFNV